MSGTTSNRSAVPRRPTSPRSKAQRNVSGTVETVTGRIDVGELGWTLPHEHFFTQPYDAPGMLVYDEEIAALELADASGVGTKSAVELTTIDLGRRPAALKRLSERTGVHVVMATGWYLHTRYPARITFASTSSLADELIADIEGGVDGIRPGVIGEIGTLGVAVEAREERVLRAVARAHLATGLPIFVHQQRVWSGPSVLEILGEEGVSAESVVLCHMDSILDPHAIDAAVDTGAWLAYDRIQGWDLVYQGRPWEVERRVQLVLRAVRDGYADRILLSTDVCVLGDLARYGGPGYAFTHGVFADRLVAAGLPVDMLDKLFGDNTARAVRCRRDA